MRSDTRQSDARQDALERLDTTTVTLVGVCPAREVIGEVSDHRYLHAGPPLGTDQLPGAMRGALLGSLMFEGEAEDVVAAESILEAGELSVSPCNTAGAVGALAGVVSPNTPVVVVEASTGVLAYSPLNEGLGHAVRFGSTDEDTLARLSFLSTKATSLLDRAIRESPKIELTALQAEGLRRGDECHNRNVASSAALLLRLMPSILRVAGPSDDADEVISRLAGNPHFFLPFSIASSKAIARSAHGIADCPIVTCMAGNGLELGIQVSGCGDRWFRAPAPLGNARLFPGFEAADAQPLMGDSLIAEAIGLGACALTAAPAICSFLGCTLQEAYATVEGMREICAGSSSRFLSPMDEFQGTPLGIDVSMVAEAGRSPVVNNGFAHRLAGKGQVGAGLTSLPKEPFLEAAGVLGQ